MSTSGLAPAGSSTYDSNTLHVGDGTWDSSRDTFLLPNLVGLNFATMRYNGMGNRFASMTEYHSLIRAHGVIAALTFLLIVPLAIFYARFYWRDPRLAIRMHIWLQILTVFLSTVVLVLGWFAVGPERSLSNPHHGIGVAIYVLIMFQVLWGATVKRWERGRTIRLISRKLMLHQWIGRALALLGIIQVALGLTLYGSPKSLFVLYALWVFFLLIMWFHYSHRYQGGGGGGGGGGDDYSSYYGGRTDISAEERRSRRHVSGGGLFPALAAAGGAAWLFNRFRRNKDEEVIEDQTNFSAVSGGAGGRPGRVSHQGSFHSEYTDEKMNEPPRNDHKWRNRILEGAALAGAVGLASRWFGRKDKRNDVDEQVTDVSGPSGRRYSGSRTDVSRMEEGNGPGTPTNNRYNRRTDRVDDDMSSIPPVGTVTPTRPPRNRLRRAGESLVSEETQSFYSPGREKRHTGRKIGEGIAAAGLGAYLWNRIRGRNKREEDRVEDIHEQDRLAERMQRRNSLGRNGRFTGDNRRRYDESISESDYTNRPGPSGHNTRPGAGAAAGAVAGAAMAEGMRPTISQVHDTSHTRYDSQNDLRPPPPIGGAGPSGAGRYDSSGSESFNTPGGGRRHRNHGEAVAAGAVAGLAGLAAGGAIADHRHRKEAEEEFERERRRRRSSGAGAVPSPDVSLRMKTSYNDGRQHITLQRLTAEEAAAQREAARRAASSHSRSRSRRESVSSLTGGNEESWRRTGGVPPPPGPGGPPPPGDYLPGPGAPYTPRPPPPPSGPGGPPQQMSPVSAGGGYYDDGGYGGPSSSIPPPGRPPIPPPHSSSPTTGGIMSPPPIAGSAYGSAAGSRADSNRQRRRAERVRAQQGGGSAGAKGSRVEFS